MKTEYFKTTTEKMYIKSELYYHLGGYNVFTYKEEKRGYYISVSPVERDGRYESYTAFTGNKKLLLEVKRQSKKAEENALKLYEEQKQQYINYIANKNNLILA